MGDGTGAQATPEAGAEPTIDAAPGGAVHDNGAAPDRPGRIHEVLLTVGILLLAAGCSILIKGLGIDVDVPGNAGSRLAAIVLGAAVCMAAFSLWPSIDQLSRYALIGGAVAVGVVLGGLVRLADPLVPDVRGLTEENAIRILDQLGISGRPVAVLGAESDGQVVDQEPDRGDRADKVTLHISSRPPPLIPDVRGGSESLARKTLASLGIEVTVELTAGEPAGQVVEMLPEPPQAGFSARLFVATGSALPEMIDVVGDTIADAMSALEERGIAVETVERASSEEVGQVIEQDPDVGDATGTAVLAVSAGSGAPVVPDVVNDVEANAVATMAEFGIEATVVKETSGTVPTGIVIGLEPEAGERSDAVRIIVSSGPKSASFAGDWTNVDPATDGLVRLTIRNDDGRRIMRGFGSCTPEACDWGEVDATLEGEQLVGTFRFEHKEVDVGVSLAGPLALAEVHHRYDDGDELLDRVVSHTLSLEPPDEIAVEDLEVIANADVLDQVVSTGAVVAIPQLAPVVFDEAPELVLFASPGG